MKKIIQYGAAALVAFVPLAASAASVTSTNLEGIINSLGPIITGVTRILDMFALVGFFWGLSMFIWNAGDEKKRAQGRQIMIWGIIALFVLVSITGLLAVLQTTFSLNQNSPIVPPSATFQG